VFEPQHENEITRFARVRIESHGGRIWATNNSDVGATFHVALPIAPGKDNS